MSEKSGVQPDVIRYTLKAAAFKIVIIKYSHNYLVGREKTNCACAHLYVWSYLCEVRQLLSPSHENSNHIIYSSLKKNHISR